MTSVRITKARSDQLKADENPVDADDSIVFIESITLDSDQSDTYANEKKKKGRWDSCLRYISLVVLVLQTTGLVLLTRYATQRKQKQFLYTVAVFFSEVFKLCATMLLFFVSSGSMKGAIKDLRNRFTTDWLDTVKVGVPALIYTVQNFLLYVAIDNLDAATYMVTAQLKILTTALFTVLMLKRRISVVQWLSLCVLIGGVVLVQINAGKKPEVLVRIAHNVTSSNHTAPITNNNVTSSNHTAPMTNNNVTASNKTIPMTNNNVTDSNHTAPMTSPMPTTDTTAASSISPPSSDQQPLIGLLAILIAGVMSGFAGIWFEKILKDSDVSIWLRNTQLSVLAIPISLAVIAIKDYERVQEDGLLQGFDFVVWSIVAIQAFRGLVVAVVIKYADNILKGFATSVSIITAALVSIPLFHIYPMPLFVAGAALVIFAVVIYSLFPYKESKKKAEFLY